MGAPTNASHRHALPYDGQPLETSALTLRKHIRASKSMPLDGDDSRRKNAAPTHLPPLGKRTASVASAIPLGSVGNRLGLEATSEMRVRVGGYICVLRLQPNE